MGAPEGREYEKQHALDFFQEYGVYGNRADGHTMQFNGPIAGNVVLCKFSWLEDRLLVSHSICNSTTTTIKEIRARGSSKR